MKTNFHDKNFALGSTFIMGFKATREWPLGILKRFPIECRKTKTKVITLANRNGCKQHNEPIRIRSKYMQLTPSAGKTRAAKTRLGLIWNPIGLESGASLLTNHRA